MSLTFEWDKSKEKENQKKHGVSFEEAITVFGDPLSLTINDPLHSYDEERFIIIGQSCIGRTLIVVHKERKENL